VVHTLVDMETLAITCYMKLVSSVGQT
jgi:hypothetical protein